MTGKTPKDVQPDAADVDAVEAEDAAAVGTAEAEESGARPAAKRKRRVRVIEVLDDEDLDEVLDAIDEEEDGADATVAASSAKTTKVTEPAKPAKRAAKAAETDEDEGDYDVEDAAEPATTAKSRSRPRKEPVRLDDAEGRTFLGLGRTQAIVVIVLVALLASLGIWQWRTASALNAKADDRAAVEKVASAYGDVALNYNAGNYQEQMKKAQALMGGDLLDSFKANTLPNLGNTFKQNPQLSLTSKTDQVFVGSVEERFASATISVDVSVRTTEGANDAPATLIRLALAKIGDEWKVTKMYASGVNDQNQNQQQGGLPGAPTSPSPGASQSPKPEETPKN